MISIQAQTPQRLISASRRTDLPGFHAAECEARLRRLRTPVHTVFFWTRHPRTLVEPGPLGDLLRWGIESPVVHLTLTGLGGTQLEPRVPPTAQVLKELDGLIGALRGDPRRLLWRFDPVIPGHTTIQSFEQLAREMGGRGVRTCIISFPAALSLKGPLAEQYRRAGIVRPGRAVRREWALRLAEAASRNDLSLQACCQPKVVQDTHGAVTAASCISAELAQHLHPRGLPLSVPRDPSQRRQCHCALSHDIGRYDDQCGSGCVYCYSSASEA